MSKIIEIEGIGEVFTQKLHAAGIHTVADLLEAGSTPKGRKELAEKTGIGDGHILKWVNHADLFRIKGVAGEYAELLEAAGVDTVVELSKRVPENLHKKLEETNAHKHLVRNTPTLEHVQGWINQAKDLPRKVHY